MRFPAALLPRLVTGLVIGLVTGLALAGCSSGDDGPSFADGEVPPSVILVSIDTLRPDHMGLYGYERDTSPYLDKLSEECLVFDRAYTTMPWTLVAHMSMMTGLEPEEHGVTTANLALSPDVLPIAQRLHDIGYRTFGFPSGECKWVSPRYGFGRGFDVYEAHSGPAEIEEMLNAELDKLTGDRPFFAFLHIFDVHTAPFGKDFTGFYDPPPPHDTAFLPDAHDRLKHVDCTEVWNNLGTLPPEEVEAMIALYDGGIRFVDSELERIIEGWRERGVLDRSILIITADHGEGLGDHGRIAGHGGMFEEGLRIPLLVRFPDGYRAGEREDGLASVIDFVPTMLEAAGLEVEPWRSGRSLRTPADDRVIRATRALISERWKSVREGEGRIYDLEADGAELAPKTEDDPQVRKVAVELRQRYQTQRAERAPVPGKAIDLDSLGEEDLQALRDLGYAGVLDD